MKYLFLVLILAGCSSLRECQRVCFAQNMKVVYWDSVSGTCKCQDGDYFMGWENQ